jgi:hypothetical protein
VKGPWGNLSAICRPIRSTVAPTAVRGPPPRLCFAKSRPQIRCQSREPDRQAARRTAHTVRRESSRMGAASAAAATLTHCVTQRASSGEPRGRSDQREISDGGGMWTVPAEPYVMMCKKTSYPVTRDRLEATVANGCAPSPFFCLPSFTSEVCHDAKMKRWRCSQMPSCDTNARILVRLMWAPILLGARAHYVNPRATK